MKINRVYPPPAKTHRLHMYQKRVMNSLFRACNFQRKLVAARRNGFSPSSTIRETKNAKRNLSPFENCTPTPPRSINRGVILVDRASKSDDGWIADFYAEIFQRRLKHVNRRHTEQKATSTSRICDKRN
ncbi:uncharacterized protein LOC122717255 [Apis laboriosa]|uniref:uncharacterized protein LOC122717255 n=1 Tax=Apis laboriosa TaxID=183418 RepID=UPI001CC7CA30|nr:uncharacterized protein LOC122717255 [Apis laboriosa]